MAVLFRFVEARAAGEDNIRHVDQLLLEVEQLARRETKFESSSMASNTTTSASRCREKGSIIGV